MRLAEELADGEWLALSRDAADVLKSLAAPQSPELPLRR